MADCFISYRRIPSASLAILIQEKLKNQRGIDAYVDTTRVDGSKVRFPERLMQAIDDAPVFICLLGQRDGEHTLKSEWVLKEIFRAYELGKFCIPIFQESYTPISNTPEAVNYLLSFDGVHVFDQKNVLIDESITNIGKLVHPHRLKNRKTPILFSLAIAIVLLAIVAFALYSDDPQSSAPTSTTAISALNTATVASTDEPTLTTHLLAKRQLFRRPKNPQPYLNLLLARQHYHQNKLQ
jgi:hypothetical protein